MSREPWKVTPMFDGGWEIEKPGGGWVAHVYEGQFPLQQETNANLIAAAPEMVELLEDVVGFINTDDPGGTELADKIDTLLRRLL